MAQNRLQTDVQWASRDRDILGGLDTRGKELHIQSRIRTGDNQVRIRFPGPHKFPEPELERVGQSPDKWPAGRKIGLIQSPDTTQSWPRSKPESRHDFWRAAGPKSRQNFSDLKFWGLTSNPIIIGPATERPLGLDTGLPPDPMAIGLNYLWHEILGGAAHHPSTVVDYFYEPEITQNDGGQMKQGGIRSEAPSFQPVIYPPPFYGLSFRLQHSIGYIRICVVPNHKQRKQMLSRRSHLSENTGAFNEYKIWPSSRAHSPSTNLQKLDSSMLSIATIFLSALLAGASPARATCSPNISGTNISITNGPLEAGFSSTGSTLVSQPISVTIPEFAVATSNSPGQFTLLSKVNDRELALTNAANLPFMAPIPSPDSRMQNWAVQCSSCVQSGDLVGAGCLVVSQFDGRCLNVSLSTTTPVGSPVTLGNCQAIGSSINIYTA
ncbi:hypothetical protein C8R45DRAFT_938480 [Mycena sanguinolenta]|nr:hypothetical protein C8R45DRAFT_938480 [Mycena sanguinolenta]